jgi:hypothetical protein
VPAAQHQIGWRTSALLVAGAAYALAMAATTPFTTSANVMTGLAIVGLAVLAVARWPWHPRPLELAPPVRGHHPYRAWAALLAAIVVWELAQYAARGSRGAHPTLSSMADAIDRHYLVKAVVVFGWLCLGALIVDKGTQASVPRRRRAREAP